MHPYEALACIGLVATVKLLIAHYVGTYLATRWRCMYSPTVDHIGAVMIVFFWPVTLPSWLLWRFVIVGFYLPLMEWAGRLGRQHFERKLAEANRVAAERRRKLMVWLEEQRREREKKQAAEERERFKTLRGDGR